MSWVHRLSVRGVVSPNAARHRGTARQHTGAPGVDKQPGPRRDQLPGAVESTRASGAGLTQSSECVVFETVEYRARLMGCRIATAGEYYRSIYSTIRKTATTCSSSIARPWGGRFRSTVEQNRTKNEPLFPSNRTDPEYSRISRCLRATIHLSRYRCPG